MVSVGIHVVPVLQNLHVLLMVAGQVPTSHILGEGTQSDATKHLWSEGWQLRLLDVHDVHHPDSPLSQLPVGDQSKDVRSVKLETLGRAEDILLGQPCKQVPVDSGGVGGEGGSAIGRFSTKQTN